MSTAAAAVTPEELLRMGSAGKGYELVNGELKEVEVSTESSRVAGEIHYRIRTFLETHPLGYVVAADAGFQCFADEPGRVRKPDAAFTSYATLPRDRYQPGGFSGTAPDIVVEVISPNDVADEVNEKRDEWLDAGVKEVWIASLTTRTVQVYRADGASPLFRARDSLTTDLLPGFSARVADIFRRPDDPIPPPVQ